MKIESWAQSIVEEMERNGYTLILTYTKNSTQVRVVFRKENTYGAARGEISDLSKLIIRASISAYRQEAGKPW